MRSPEFKKMLICLDGSRLSEQILPYAAEEAKRFGGKAILLRVLHEPAMYTATVPGTVGVPAWTPGLEEQLSESQEEAKQYLLEKAGMMVEEYGLTVDSVTMHGPPGESIINYARDNEIDLIAIATHGRTGIERAFIGSVADHVLRESGLPVLVIRPREGKS